MDQIPSNVPPGDVARLGQLTNSDTVGFETLRATTLPSDPPPSPNIGAPTGTPPHQQQPAYQPQPIYITQQVQMAPAYVLAVQPKSMFVTVLLSFLFGPLGMLYSTIPGAIVMFFLSILLAAFTYGISILITWPVCVIWAAIAASNYNARISAAHPHYSQNAR